MNPQVIRSLAGGAMRKCKSLLYVTKHQALLVSHKKDTFSLERQATNSSDELTTKCKETDD